MIAGDDNRITTLQVPCKFHFTTAHLLQFLFTKPQPCILYVLTPPPQPPPQILCSTSAKPFCQEHDAVFR